MSTIPVDPDRCARTRTAVEAARVAEHEVLLGVAQMVADGVAADLGYRSTARMIEDAFRVDPGVARRWVARSALLAPRVSLTGQELPPVLPATAAGAAQGALDDGHLRVIATTMDHLSRIPELEPTQFAAAEARLAEYAATLAPRGLEKVAERLIQRLDPDGAAPPENGEPADELHLLPRRDGTLRIAGDLQGRAEADLVRETFDRLSAPAGADDARSLARRHAETLYDLCAQANAPGGIAHRDDDHGGEDLDAGRPEADEDAEDADIDVASGLAESGEKPENNLFDVDEPGTEEPDTEEPDTDADEPTGAADETRGARGTWGEEAAKRCGCPEITTRPATALTVTMNLEWLLENTGHGLLDSGLAVSPEVARRLACDTRVIPAVLGTRGEILDVGRAAYTPPATVRRAVILRDGGCTFPGCTRRPRRCHAHHVIHWLDGGDTALDNLTLLCRYHHHLVHHDHWYVEMIDGKPWYTPPAAVDPTRTPRPGRPG